LIGRGRPAIPKHEKRQVINRFHVEQFAHFLARLKSMREGDGTLLDHSPSRRPEVDKPGFG